MDALVTEMGTQGYPLSVLYPATATVYRRVGYELAGAQYQVSMPARSLRSLLPPDVPAGEALPALRRVGPGDAAEIDAVIGQVPGGSSTTRTCSATSPTTGSSPTPGPAAIARSRSTTWWPAPP
jgi:hypothetical protein